jgi:hypothetical protein
LYIEKLMVWGGEINEFIVFAPIYQNAKFEILILIWGSLCGINMQIPDVLESAGGCPACPAV